jgi:hypothetical protein
MLMGHYFAMLWLFQSDAFGTEEQRTETVMINLTDIDERLQNHQARLARVDQEGWLIEAATESRSTTRGRRSANDRSRNRPLRRMASGATECRTRDNRGLV